MYVVNTFSAWNARPSNPIHFKLLFLKFAVLAYFSKKYIGKIEHNRFS